MEPGISLRQSQIVDLTFLMQTPRAALLHDPAVGKTPSVCVYMWWMWSTNHQRSIWVMPGQLMEKNKEELLRFTHFTSDDVMILDGRPEDKIFPEDDPKVIIMGAARFKLSWRALLKRFPDINLLAADETHMFWATDGSQQTQQMYMAMQKIERFVAMTGSIIKGRLSSAYPVIHVIEPRYYASYDVFLGYHHVAEIPGAKKSWVHGGRIAQIMGKHALKRSFEDEYGAEAKVIVTEQCQMSPKQRMNYDKFEAEAILELEDSMLTGSGGGVFALRCNQIMAHPETWGLAEAEVTGKDEQLLIHAAHHANTGEPCIVYPFFIPEQERIAKLLEKQGMTVGVMNGNTSSKERGAIDRAFRAGEIQWLVGSPQIAVVGYNWGHVNHVIFPTVPYGDDILYQAYRRAIRGVRTTPLLITIFEYANSIDQRKMAIIRAKSKLAQSVEHTREVYDLSFSHQ
jgi:hypothetical protein